MSLQNIRNFSSSTGRKLLILLGKVTLEDVRSTNGPKGDQWVSSVTKIRDDVETQASATNISYVHLADRQQYTTAAGYEIQGAKAHKSSKDPSDPDDVLTIAFYSQNGTRLLSGHIHENGTYKLAESRAGKGKGSKQK
ncbi:hypothetical protein POX_a00740 [Penicillium oxalicum]|uniref:hypothetical protein n=1 Tax=Penicillium oxalicum TaxID=69781 RepID=UPI0020B71F1B|nr:hypothetical protein POX_a00740 [Penicillium oxalicum]KAI2794150.1 hypothetical protein POX_a00740 [Penicillium oxalicum]